MEWLILILMLAVGVAYFTKDDPGRLWTDAAFVAAFVAFITIMAADPVQWTLYMIPAIVIALGREWWRQRLYRRSRAIYVRDSTDRDRL